MCSDVNVVEMALAHLCACCATYRHKVHPCRELSANQQSARIVLPMVTHLHMDGGTVLCVL